MEKRKIAILGSTGSIGRQALDVIRHHRDKFEVILLTANNNSDLLVSQAIEFDADTAIICNEALYDKVSSALANTGTKVFSGTRSVIEYLEDNENIDIVLTAMVGFSGVRPTIAAIKSGKVIALANKETLVAAGSVVTALSRQYRAPILPVDSEHSAIFQSLRGEGSAIEKILLTASGGPFRNSTLEEIRNATVAQALKHPKWNMGSKVTIDSASMMNKGLEMIEAKWLFSVEPKDIQIVVHPESIIHSMVQFSDGAIIAQMSTPDMRLPIQYALSYPHRLEFPIPRANLAAIGSFSFFDADTEKFPCIKIAYDAIEKGGNTPCIMNAANEIAVNSVLEGRLPFYRIAELVEKTISKVSHIAEPDIDDIFHSDTEGRIRASEILKTMIA